MSNGKFFSGLPERMMGRKSGPDRQKSTFFWPDESDSSPVTTPNRRITSNGSFRNNSGQSINVNQQNGQVDVVPKKLVERELSSKIEFYDYVDKNDNKKNNKNSSVLTNRKVNNNEKKDVEYVQDDYAKNGKYLNNSPTKNYDKRITFAEGKNHQQPKGILKNIESVIETPINKKPPMNIKKNLSKSKSTSDIIQNNIESIENDVENMSLMDKGKHVENKSHIEENIIYDSRTSNQNIDSSFSKPSSHELQFDCTVDEFANKTNYNEPHRIRNKNGADYHYENRHHYSNDQEQHYEYENNKPFGINEAANRSNRSVRSGDSRPPIPRVGVYLGDRNINITDTTTNSNFKTSHIIPMEIEPRQSSHTDDNHSRMPGSFSNSHRNSIRTYPHLVSNLPFGQNNSDAPPSQHRTVRNSAVSRVSVGLPEH